MREKTNIKMLVLSTARLCSLNEGLPGVLGNKGTSPFTFREQGIFQNNF